MHFKKSLAVLFIIISFSVDAAKPTDDEVLKQVTTAKMQEVKLSSSGGTFSTYNLQHWWTRGVTYKTNANLKEFPNASITIGAEARYRIVGENYDFDKLKSVWSEYQGIPSPSDAEILALLNNKIELLIMPYILNKMVSKLEGPSLSKDPSVKKIQWHTANSFTLHVQAKYSVIASNTEVKDMLTDFEVRFYRDDVNKPWKENFYTSNSKEKVLATHKYTAQEINAMPTQASKAAEKQAQAATAGLPSVAIPEFANDKEAFAFIYQQLRSGNKKQVEAMFRAMASNDYLVAGSKIQLNNRGKETLEKIIHQVFDNKISFADSYCPQVFVQSYQANMINIVDALRKNKSRIALTMSGGSYERGKKVGQAYKITALEVWTLRTDDDVAQLKSWPFDELCADVAKTFQQLSTNESAANANNQTATKDSNTATTAKETTIKEPAKSWAWTTFTSQYLPVSMQIIGAANEKQKMANGKQATSMIAKSNEGTFRMVATDYKQQITEEIANPTHIQFAKSFVKSNNALIHKKQVSKLGTGDAQEYLIERGNGEQKVMVKFIIFSHGTVVYQVMYSQLKSRFDKKRASEFIGSIKVG